MAFRVAECGKNSLKTAGRGTVCAKGAPALTAAVKGRKALPLHQSFHAEGMGREGGWGVSNAGPNKKEMAALPSMYLFSHLSQFKSGLIHLFGHLSQVKPSQAKSSQESGQEPL